MLVVLLVKILVQHSKRWQFSWKLELWSTRTLDRIINWICDKESFQISISNITSNSKLTQNFGSYERQYMAWAIHQEHGISGYEMSSSPMVLVSGNTMKLYSTGTTIINWKILCVVIKMSFSGGVYRLNSRSKLSL